MRAFDGETTPSQREELAALADTEPRLAALAELREALRFALAAPGPVDVAGEVMGALADEAAWDLGGALRDAVGGPIDVAEGVFEGIALDAPWAHGPALREAVSAPVDVADTILADVDEAAWAPVGAALVDAVRVEIDAADAVMAVIAEEAAFAWIGDVIRDTTARDVDVWAEVADAIGVERDVVHGWDAIAAPLREAYGAAPRIDVADAVMAAVADRVGAGGAAEGAEVVPLTPRATPKMPLWASLGAPLLAFAAAAALLFTVILPEGGPISPAAVQLATVNDAHVEEISAAQDVVVQVMQFEDGGPTFILVDDPSGSGVPL